MIAFKKFKSNDIIVTPFTVNKSFIFQGDHEFTGSDVGIDRLIGVNTSSLFNSSSDLTTGILSTSDYSYGPYQRFVYDTIYQLYYSNFTNSVLGSGSYNNSLQSDLIPSRSFPEYEEAEVVVFSIPQKLFGNYIKPGSFSLTSSDFTAITDDGEGNIISNDYAGNIIYNEGIVTIFSPFEEGGNVKRYDFKKSGTKASVGSSWFAVWSDIEPFITKYFSWGSGFATTEETDDDDLVNLTGLNSPGNSKTFQYTGANPGIIRYRVKGRIKVTITTDSEVDVVFYTLSTKVSINGSTNNQASSGQDGLGQFVAVNGAPETDIAEFDYESEYFQVPPNATILVNIGVTPQTQGGKLNVSTPVFQSPNDFLSSIGSELVITDAITGSNVTMSFESSVDIYETQYKCTMESDEFNYSLNPTLLSESISSSILTSGSDTYVDFATGSEFTPFVTAVGLYNDNNELLAIGKLSQPLPTSQTTDTTILINLDR